MNVQAQFYIQFSSPVGLLTVVRGPLGICKIIWQDEQEGLTQVENLATHNPTDLLLCQARSQIKEYFLGTRTTFDLPLAPEGTEFQKKTWLTLAKIPYGKTISYGQQAALLGDVKKARAVGAANGKNPLSIVVPCHRVVGANGALTGFAGGLEAKKLLLDLEKKCLANLMHS